MTNLWEPHPLSPLLWTVRVTGVDPARRLSAITTARRFRPDIALDTLRRHPDGIVLRTLTRWGGGGPHESARLATAIRDECEAVGLHVAVETWHHTNGRSPDREDEGIACISLQPHFVPCGCGCGGAWWTVDGYLSRKAYAERRARLAKAGVFEVERS